MSPRFAWVLNLDAEVELERGAPAAMNTAARARSRAMQARFAEALGPDDMVLDLDADAERARGRIGVCYCPTPSALARLAAAGATVPAAPPLEVLRRANDRELSFALGALPGAARCADVAALERALGAGGRWILKRGFTFAGRGHRRVDGRCLSDADRAWIAASLRRGPLYAEPRVDVRLEAGLHGRIAADGAVARGRPTVQATAHGAWLESRRAAEGELAPAELRALEGALDRAAAALIAIGYFGPFGVDALRYVQGDGELAFHPLSEINARYSMGYAAGMGALP